MTTDIRILARDDATDRLAYQIMLLRTYGLAATIHTVETAFAVDAPNAIWLTLDRREVPTLTALSEAWSTDLLGGLGCIASAEHLRDLLTDLGLHPSTAAARGTIEGYAWRGTFRATVIHGAPQNRTRLLDTCQEVCARLGIERCYLRFDFGDGDAIVDVSPVPGHASMISQARLAGFCPLWAFYCVVAGSDPVMPLLDAGATAEHTPS